MVVHHRTFIACVDVKAKRVCLVEGTLRSVCSTRDRTPFEMPGLALDSMKIQDRAADISRLNRAVLPHTHG